MNSDNLLFARVDWNSVLQGRLIAMHDEINGLDQDRLLNTSADTLCKYYEDKNIVEVPILDLDGVVVDYRETPRTINDYGRKTTIKATEIEVILPFTGPSGAFDVTPTHHILNLPRAVVGSGFLTFYVSATNRNDEQVRAEIDRTLGLIKQELESLRRDVDRSQLQIARAARDFINQRREKVLADSKLVSSLGYKLKQRSDVSRTFAPPEVRRKITPRLPPKTTERFQPEPALPLDDYEHIIDVIENMALVMERSPSAFMGLDEEALRFHFVVQLNGHYEGAATGETFNYEGKTDILIRVDGRNIFVAECKFWSGPAALQDTVNQLLGYASWRDTKTAIILFNTNKNFSKVLEVIPETIVAHENFVRTENVKSETRFRFVLSHRDDPSRELTLTVLAFDVPRP